MKLILNTPGLSLRKTGERFLIAGKESKEEISAKKVEQILITTHTSLTTDAIELALENNIDIVFLKWNGQPMGRVWHSKLGSITTIRRKQLFLQDEYFGVVLVKEWITDKLNNQISFLNKLAYNRRDSRQELINCAVDKVRTAKEKIEKSGDVKNIEDIREWLLGIEGSSGRIYFETLSELLPEKYRYKGRSRNPAEDFFNCFLNYSYGILYTNVEKACILAGLDPYIGIMHTDNYNKKALVFDLVEKYRSYMDEIVFKLFSTKKVTDDCCDEIEGGYYLNQNGKKLLITEYNAELEKKIKYNGKNIEFANIIQFDCHKLANRILKENF